VFEPITKRHILISGFTQSVARPTGVEKLWLWMRKHEAPSCRVSMLEWDSDWAGFAEHVLRTANSKVKELDVRCYAYSWGCGYGFLKLAAELRRRGMRVSRAVLCDPVYHSWKTPWRAVFSPFWTPKISVPDNVGEVWYFRQKQTKPAGHELIAAAPGTKINPPAWLECGHAYADDAPEFHDLALEVAAE